MDATAITDSGAAQSAASITLENVGKVYEDGTVAVGDFSLDIQAGDRDRRGLVVRDRLTGRTGKLGAASRAEMAVGRILVTALSTKHAGHG